MIEQRVRYPLWWCLEPAAQAKFMIFQYENYGEKLDIPTPPMTSKGVWLTVEMENTETIDKLMRQTRRHFKGVDVDH